MEYFERGDMRALFGADMTRERALTVVQHIAQALSAIHRHGIVHRDVKPENVILRSDGSVALADFGIASPCCRPKTCLTRPGMGMWWARRIT